MLVGTDLGALGLCGPPSASASNNVDHFAHLLLHSPSFQFPSIEPSNKLMQQNEEAAQEVQSSTCAAAQEEETEDESDSESEDVAGHTVRHEDDTAAALASFSTSEHVICDRFSWYDAFLPQFAAASFPLSRF